MKLSGSLVGKLTIVAVTSITIVALDCGGDSVTAPKTCVANELLCGTACIDSATDPANCGACGAACKPGEVCGSGACALTCSGNSKQCGQSCFDTQVDPANCGGCGKKCDVGQVCNAGACGAQCPDAQKLCVADGGAVSCVTTTTDRANCGGCGVTCDTGKVCNAGVCSDSCGAGGTFCAGNGMPYCALTEVDNANCGACGKVCGNGLVCAGGKCGGNCGPNEILCPGQDGGADFCAVTQSDNVNCGACGNVCGQGLLCSLGKCVSQCGGGLTQCGKQCVDTQSDRDNCNGCGVTCSGGTPHCIGGTCGAGIVYSQTFPTGIVKQGDVQCTEWTKFQSDLVGVFSTVKFYGSNDLTGYTCAGADADTICQALHKSGSVSVVCNGHTWNVDLCGSGTELNVDQVICDCADPAYVVRPCIDDDTWGGINGPTCSAKGQSITVECQ